MNTSNQVVTPTPSTNNKEWGRAISGGLAVLSTLWLSAMACSRILDTANSNTLPSKEQLMLAFFYVVAAACVATMRGVITIGIGAGRGRTPLLLIGVATSVVILIIVAALVQPAAPPFPFWIALSLPVVGSFIEDRLVSK